MSFEKIMRTTEGAYNNIGQKYPQLQVYDNKVYYVWISDRYNIDGTMRIKLGQSDLDGSNFTVIELATITTLGTGIQFQIVNDKIYYTWRAFTTENHQVFVARSNLDGSNFIAVRQTSTGQISDVSYDVQLQVYNGKIYYVWPEDDNLSGNWCTQIYTGISDLDGSNFTSTRRTNNSYDNVEQPQLQIYADKLYYVYREQIDMGGYHRYQLILASSNLDGSNFVSQQITNRAQGITDPQFQIINDKIYYLWSEPDGNGDYQIYLGISNLDGSNFSLSQLTTSGDNWYPQLIVGNDKIYYCYSKGDITYTFYDLYAAESDLTGLNFTETQKTVNNGMDYPQVCINGNNFYYVWTDGDIWTGIDINITPISLNVEPKNIFLGVGYQSQYTAILAYSDGSLVDVTTTAAWAVDNPQLAVIVTGMVTALARGTVVVSATAAGLSGQTNVYIKQKRCDGYYDPPISGGKIVSCDGRAH